jgi:hypothetical protein
MTKIQTVIASIILSCFIIFVPLVSADDLTMTTYYPAPSGNYQNLTVSTLVTTLNANVTGTLTAANFNPAIINTTGNVGVGGILNVTGDTQINGDLTVIGQSSLRGNTIVGVAGDLTSGHLTANNSATVYGLLDLHAPLGGPSVALTIAGNSTIGGNINMNTGNLTLTAGGVTVTAGNITLTAGSLTANGGVNTNILTASDQIIGNTLAIASKARIGNDLGGSPTLIAGTGADTIALAINGNTATSANWINSNGTSNFGMNFSVKRVAINTTAGNAAGDPILKIVYPSALTIEAAKTATLLELGSTSHFSTATDATARINGSLSVAYNATFKGEIKGYKGITVGSTADSCSSSILGKMEFRCTSSTPLGCTLRICAPTNGSTGYSWQSVGTWTNSSGGCTTCAIQEDSPVAID